MFIYLLPCKPISFPSHNTLKPPICKKNNTKEEEEEEKAKRKKLSCNNRFEATIAQIPSLLQLEVFISLCCKSVGLHLVFHNHINFHSIGHTFPNRSHALCSCQVLRAPIQVNDSLAAIRSSPCATTTSCQGHNLQAHVSKTFMLMLIWFNHTYNILLVNVI